MRGRFLSLLSHELRNPLAPILMWTSTLRRLRRDDAEVQRASEAIEHAVGLARALIEEVSEVSRLERGLLEVECRPFDLRDPVRSAVEQARPGLEERELKVLAEIPDEPVPAQGDAARLKQVVGHLLGNAAKFGTPGGIVTVQVSREGERATLRVSDTGPGLPSVLLPQLFTPFVQGPNAHGGLGVGLALSHRLLALQNGTIQALPPDDQGGATFVVSLPRPTP
jgi:signal transduction histidine kinase